MKKLLLQAVLSVLPFFSMAQYQQLNLSEQQLQTYISEVFGESFVENQPDLVQLYSVLLNNRIQFKQEQQSSDEKYPLLSSFSLINKNNPAISPVNPATFSLENFNPLTYDFGFFLNRELIVRIDGTDFLMLVSRQ